MDRKERARCIQKILEEHFPNPSSPLQHKDPYTLLIAVLLSAQSTDRQVNRVTKILFSLGDSPEKICQLSEKKIEEVIRPCGLSKTKSAAILKASKILLEKHNGKVPESLEELEDLPGVGHKTASVVVAQAFGHDAFPVDTHILRCSARWRLSESKTASGVERDLKEAFPQENWSKLHLQIIYFARKYCPARGHDAKKCPICSVFVN